MALNQYGLRTATMTYEILCKFLVCCVLHYLDVVALVQLPSVEGGHSLLSILWGEEVHEGETLGQLGGFIERVRQPVLSNRSRSAEDLSDHSSELLVLLLSHLRVGLRGRWRDQHIF